MIKLFLITALALTLTPAHAGTLSVSGPVNGQVVIEADDAGLDEVLARLAQHHGFAVDGALQALPSRRISGRIQGNLDAVLSRLLRAESFTVVHSSTAPSGVARVVLSVGRSGASSTAGVDAPALGAVSSPRSPANPASKGAGQLNEPSLPAAVARGHLTGTREHSEPASAIPGEASAGSIDVSAVPWVPVSELHGPVQSTTSATFEGPLPSSTPPTAWGRSSLPASDAVPSAAGVADIQPPSPQIGEFRPGTHPR